MPTTKTKLCCRLHTSCPLIHAGFRTSINTVTERGVQGDGDSPHRVISLNTTLFESAFGLKHSIRRSPRGNARGRHCEFSSLQCLAGRLPRGQCLSATDHTSKCQTPVHPRSILYHEAVHSCYQYPSLNAPGWVCKNIRWGAQRERRGLSQGMIMRL